MKTKFLAGAFAVLAAPALAADLGPAPVVGDWSGFYAGVHAGYGWGDSDLSSPFFDLLPGDLTTSFDLDGGFGGAQAGFNFQSGDFVFGLEGDISASGIEGDVVIDPDAGPVASVLDAEVNWMATARGRIGFSAGRFLPYITGGLAVADVDVTSTNTPAVDETYSGSETFFGWTVGAGFEVAITDSISAKAEYLYADFGEEDYVVAPGPDGTVSADFQLHTVKAGLNFHF